MLCYDLLFDFQYLFAQLHEIGPELLLLPQGFPKAIVELSQDLPPFSSVLSAGPGPMIPASFDRDRPRVGHGLCRGPSVTAGRHEEAHLSMLGEEGPPGLFNWNPDMCAPFVRKVRFHTVRAHSVSSRLAACNRNSAAKQGPWTHPLKSSTYIFLTKIM
jgi:hypothetical protein